LKAGVPPSEPEKFPQYTVPKNGRPSERRVVNGREIRRSDFRKDGEQQNIKVGTEKVVKVRTEDKGSRKGMR